MLVDWIFFFFFCVHFSFPHTQKKKNSDFHVGNHAETPSFFFFFPAFVFCQVIKNKKKIIIELVESTFFLLFFGWKQQRRKEGRGEEKDTHKSCKAEKQFFFGTSGEAQTYTKKKQKTKNNDNDSVRKYI